jgi:hypothetical protein
VNIGQFVALLTNSGLIRQPEAQTIATAFQDGCRELCKEATVESFCDFLVETGRLTKWQCNKLHMGKWKGFYLDDYLFLEQIGKGADYSSYKARDTRNGRIVCLVVTPIAMTGRIQYRVEPFVG